MTSKIFDADRHVTEPASLWTDHVDQQLIAGFEVSLKFNPQSEHKLPPEYRVGPYPVFKDWGVEVQIGMAEKLKRNSRNAIDAMEPQTQLLSMDEANITKASIFPTFAAYIVNHQQLPAQVSLAYAQGYNRWLKDYCDHNPQRLNAVGVISRHQPSNMVKQLAQIIDYGWRSVTMPPELIKGCSLAHPDYEAFWQACAKHNISVCLHGGSNLQASSAGTDRYNSRFALLACCNPMEMQMAFLSLLESGVLERNPTLKLGLLEAGCSWVPHWLWRLDNICYPEFPKLVEKNISMLPSEYFKRHCWVGFELEEPWLAQVIALIGHQKLLFGSDFPHPDHMHFNQLDIRQALGDIADQMVEDILYNNPTKFFG